MELGITSDHPAPYPSTKTSYFASFDIDYGVRKSIPLIYIFGGTVFLYTILQ